VTPVADPIPDPIPSPLSSFANGLVAALLAPVCAVCDAVLDEPLRGCVCQACWTSVKRITPPICDACGDPLPAPTEYCWHCFQRPQRVIDRSRAVGDYDGSLRDILHALKYAGRRSLARPLARLMAERGAELIAAADCVVPVPLYWRREYQRGFNQARQLAQHLALPCLEPLVRVKPTRAQVELTADERRANVQGAFRVRAPWRRTRRPIGGMTVLLIDDVCTTAATLEACASALRDAGVRTVYALTAARVVTRRQTPGPGVR